MHKKKTRKILKKDACEEKTEDEVLVKDITAIWKNCMEKNEKK